MAEELPNLNPTWFQALQDTEGVKKVDVREWKDQAWRNGEGGFIGEDFCHSPNASVRVVDYVLLPSDPDNPFPKLVGVTYFSKKSESHKGLCHGGSFCALMDDIIGWLGFCVSGDVVPWSGYTVQINTALKKPVVVGSVLKLEAWINKKEGTRKYWINSRLTDVESNVVHSEGEGLFIMTQNTAASPN